MENTTEAPAPTVMKTALRFGLISSLINIAYFLIIVLAGVSPFENSWWRGLIQLGIGIALIVWSHNYFKANGDGFMSYGQGFGIAFLMSVVSLLISFIFNYIYTRMDPSVLEAVWNKAMADAQARGGNGEMAVTWTKKLFWVIFFVFGLFFSAVLALLVTIFTQKKKPESAF